MAQKRRTIKKTAGKKAAPQKKNEAERKGLSSETKKEIAFVAALFFSILLILAIYSTSLTANDPASSVGTIKGASLIGHLGVITKWLLMGLFGPVSYILPFLSAALGIYILKTVKSEKPMLHIYISGILFTVCLSALFYVFGYAFDDPSFNLKDFWCFGTFGIGGGAVGSLFGYPLVLLSKPTGAAIILFMLLIIFFVAMTDFALTKYLASLVRGARESGRKKADSEEESLDEASLGDGEASLQKHEPPEEKHRKKDRYTRAAEEIVPTADNEYENLAHAVEALPLTGEKSKKEDAEAEAVPLNMFDKSKPSDDNASSSVAPDNGNPSAEELMAEEASSLSTNERVKRAGEEKVDISRENNHIPYVFPKTTLLSAPSSNAESSDPAALRTLSEKLVATLKTFNIDVKILEINKGPAITRFELQPTAGVRVSKITSLADDIALSLAATSVRIEAPIPGKAAIGIEVPNSTIATVTVRDVLESPEFKNSKSPLSCALGRDIAGKCIVGDIAKWPHVLIAGATGSGKSVCINSLVASILYKASPNDVKLIMIDPKVVELSVYNGIPHLLIPVVTDARKAAGSLNWAVQEMTTRYRLFAENAVRNLKGYNELMDKKGMARLPQIVIIIDELADLMMVASKDVESYICRLAQLARAAGMHLVIATQRPSVNVITGVIKANIPSRIAFAVSSNTDSRTILDAGGAEKLLGKGDMLYYPMGASKPVRVQGAFISDDEVERLVEFVKKDSEAVYDEDVLEIVEKSGEGDSSDVDEEASGDADPLLSKAIEIVVDAGQASVSLVQRRLSVGYSRAGRLIDQMENRGIIGPHEGSKPRRVLVTKAEYLAMLEGASLAESQNDENPEAALSDGAQQASELYSVDGADEGFAPVGQDEFEDEDDEIILPPTE